MFNRLSFIIGITALALIVGVFVSPSVEKVEAQDFGTGPWTASFYNNTGFTDPVVATTTYTTLNFNWGAGAPLDQNGVAVPGVGADNFSVRFASAQNFNAGTYTFTVTVDDRARLFLNDTQVIDITTPNTTQSAQVVLAGGIVNMRVEFIEFTDAAFLQVQWGVAGAATPVPGVTPGVDPGTGVIVEAPTAGPPPPTGLPDIPPGFLRATVIRASVLNVRQAPSTGAARIGRILRGQTYAVLGRDPDARWFLLQFSGFQGWAYGYYLFIDGNEFNAPIVSGNALFDLAGQTDYGVRAQSEAGLKLRAAPTTRSEQIGRIDWGAIMPVVGRTAGGSWWKVVWKSTVGWVYSPFMEIIDGNIRDVPVEG